MLSFNLRCLRICCRYVPGMDPFLSWIIACANSKHPSHVNSISWGSLESVRRCVCEYVCACVCTSVRVCVRICDFLNMFITRGFLFLHFCPTSYFILTHITSPCSHTQLHIPNFTYPHLLCALFASPALSMSPSHLHSSKCQQLHWLPLIRKP